MTGFSIIIPCYNAAETLEATLASIRAQSHSAWEVICVNDGSTDATRAIVEAARARDTRIRVIDNIGKGPSRARNLGALFCANYPIIAFCDADDLWGPDKLSELAEGFADPDVAAVFGKIAFFEDDPAQARRFSTVPDAPLSIPMLLGENPVCTMSNIAVRRKLFRRLGGFDEGMVHNEDLEWLIRLVGSGARVIGLDRCQVWYRASRYGLSADLEAMAQGRARALRTAARLGHVPGRCADAVFWRYLSRRALRLGQGRVLPLRLALRGLRRCPRGFFDPPRRGALTLVAALAVPFLPTRTARHFFSR